MSLLNNNQVSYLEIFLVDCFDLIKLSIGAGL